ncbi:hypothetical protein EGW08_020883 [Elysia chlorotica]|uniref:Uncharacterized protein n=1 Tax=Elysia chlorotica TaxID=188477 RepID=A0A3S1AT34_ELYCH|nr:hypothetical protein EGW08_020883 [Elysia chlorotica]
MLIFRCFFSPRYRASQTVMTVATSPSTSPHYDHIATQPPETILFSAKSSGSDNVASNQDEAITSNEPGHPNNQHPLPELRSRALVDSLLEEADSRALLEMLAEVTCREGDASQAGGVHTTVSQMLGWDLAKTGEPEDEVVYGWQRSSGLVVRKTGVAARSVGAGIKRKVGLRSTVSSSSLDMGAGPSGAYSSSAPPGGVVRCISEDYVPGAHSHRRAAWKSNVEPGTYRYIVNNGIYRSTKFASLGGDWVTAKRSRGGAGAAAASVSSSTDPQSQTNSHQYRASISNSSSGPRNSDVRHKQSIIKRDLNRYTFLNNSIDVSSFAHKRLNFEHSTIKEGDQSFGLSPSPANLKTNKKESSSHADTCSNLKQTDKSGSNPQQQQRLHQQQNQLQPPLPPWSSSSSCYSRPDTRDPQLVKSASDLFVENFSSKIDALEKEDPTAGTPDCLPRPGTNPAVAMNSLQSSSAAATSRRACHKTAQHHLYPHDTVGNQLPPTSSSSAVSNKSSVLLQEDDIARDVFTVRPAVGIRAADQMPLNPLEKLTPQMQKKAQKGKSSNSTLCYSQEGCSEGRSDVTSSLSRENPASGVGPKNRSNNSTPLGGDVSPPHLSTSFMTAMNAFSQIHHHYHLAYDNRRTKGDGNGQYSKSSPPTFRSTRSNGSSEKGGKSSHRNVFYSSGSSNKYPQNQTPSDVDSLSSVKNALTMTNSDIEKMRMNHLAVRDYNRYISTRPKPQVTSLAAGKPPTGNKRTSGSSASRPPVLGTAKTLGLRPFNTTSAPMANKSAQPAGDDLSGVQSDSEAESFLTGTSLMAPRGARERGMSLPEISGKRLSVTTSSQRML